MEKDDGENVVDKVYDSLIMNKEMMMMMMKRRSLECITTSYDVQCTLYNIQQILMIVYYTTIYLYTIYSLQYSTVYSAVVNYLIKFIY